MTKYSFLFSEELIGTGKIDRSFGIMVFYPTEDDLKQPFDKYISFMESEGADKAGIAKIVPPKSYIPRRNGYEDMKVLIKSINSIVHTLKILF